jgi:hypothetical protein
LLQGESQAAETRQFPHARAVHDSN